MNDDIKVHPGGPYIQAAFLCERVLTEADGTNTYVRVVDRFSRPPLGSSRPEGSTPHVVDFTVVALIRAGRAQGPVELHIRPQLPSGHQLSPQVLRFPVREHAGLNVHVPVRIETVEQGQYCIQLILNDLLAAEAPFTVDEGFVVMGQRPPAT